MKKAKIMLFAIGVLAVVGGALALKAKTATKPLLCYAKLLRDDGKCISAIRATITTPPQKQFDALYSTEVVPEDMDPDVFCTTIDCDHFGLRPFKIDL